MWRGCPKCHNRWSVNWNEAGEAWCIKDPPYSLGCGKRFRFKRMSVKRRIIKERENGSTTQAE